MVSQNCTALKVLQISAEIVVALLPGPGQLISSAIVKGARAVSHVRWLKWVKTVKAGIKPRVPVGGVAG